MATSQWICNDLIANKNILTVDYDNVLKMKAKTFTLLHNELVNGISYITDKTLLPTLQMLLKITINQNSKFLGSQPSHSYIYPSIMMKFGMQARSQGSDVLEICFWF